MSDVELNFERSEYDARLAKTRAAMDKAGVDLLVVTDPANMAWLTGYDGWSFYVHQCVLVAEVGDPVWFGRGQDANGARLTVYMGDDEITSYPDHYVQSPDRHPMECLAGVIGERGWQSRSVGVEMDNYYFSAAAFASLQRHLSNVRFADATGLVNWQRAVKSERELQYMRTAARITDTIQQRILEKVAPGVRRCDIAADIYDAGLRGVDGCGGDYPSIVPLLPSGKAMAAPHLTWDDQPLRAGEGTFFEVAGCYKRYHCPLSRTVFLGSPPRHFLDAEEAVLEGLAAGLEAARPGNTCENVAATFFDVLRRRGFEKDSRTGYPIGLSYPPDWGERTMSFRAGDKSILEENMTFHFMTGLWMEDWGLEITESIRIAEGGAECLASVPRKLLVID